MLDRWRDNNAAAAAVNLFGRHRKNKLEAVFVEKKMQITFRSTDIEMTGSSRTGNMPGGKQQQRK